MPRTGHVSSQQAKMLSGRICVPRQFCQPMAGMAYCKGECGMGHRANFIVLSRFVAIELAVSVWAPAVMRVGMAVLDQAAARAGQYYAAMTMRQLFPNSVHGLREGKCSYASSNGLCAAMFSSWNSFFMGRSIFCGWRPGLRSVRKFNLRGPRAFSSGLTICGDRTFCS